ncbi:tRNA 2-thiocytidine(32) synthetase TtcA [Deinococcus roseus]|uniref:tRNA-cytidine(32) 2-sulfurtransferase n=1 Tax=Deinococcus roseus TaxID=392414 RepID=A0ABQ2D5N0_9DEIO|nr:tRNA 2-thiocytidine(32) synthetase TtcA [Deinococcus roseus]GGJ42025.1 tRNA 2-thiocytidine biosynthesis protein TtcA [Deinococcus roseus]
MQHENMQDNPLQDSLHTTDTTDTTEGTEGTEKSYSGNFFRLKRQLERQVAQAITDYGMIDDGDTVLVCLSGGKDSYTMLDTLMELQKRAPIDFKLIAMNLDQKQPGFPSHILPEYLKNLGVEYRILEQDTYSVVKEKIPEGKTMCSLCSRLRRGAIYTFAREIGANKIALGHHRDDILETFFMNMFFGSRLKAMPPKLVSDDGQNVVIRPLAYCTEKDIERYARAREFPIIPCNLCGSQENLQRRIVGEMLESWERQSPGRLNNIFRALSHVSASHLLDPGLFDFRGLTRDTVVPEGDIAFDQQDFKPERFEDALEELPLI